MTPSITSGRSLVLQSGLALGASAAIALSLMVTSILITRTLGVTGRGEVAAAVLIPTVVSYVGQMGIPTAVAYWINTDPSNRDAIIGTGRCLALMISGILLTLSWVLINVAPLDDRVRGPALLFSLYIPFNLLPPVDSAVLQADMRSRALNVVRLVNAIVYLALVAAFVLLGWASTYTMIIAQLVAVVVWLIVASRLANTSRMLSFDQSQSRRLLAYGARAHLGTVQPVDTLRLDQIILGLFLSTHALGTYVVAMTFVTANRMVGTSIGMVAFPFASRSHYSSHRRSRLYRIVAVAALVAGAAAAMQVIFGRQLLQVLFDLDSEEAYAVLVILVGGSVIMVVRQVLGDILRGLGYPLLPAISEAVLFVTLAISAYGFWSLGTIGVAWAVTGSAAFSLAALTGLSIRRIA
jgi:O-antigen/teichoic acid export membrane protein